MNLDHPKDLPIALFTCDECTKRRAVVCIAEKYWCHKCLCPEDAPLYEPQGASSIALMEELAPGRYDVQELNRALRDGPAADKIHLERWSGRF